MTGDDVCKWSFDAEVTRVFDDMLSRSIPQYEVMRDLCTEIAVVHARHGSKVVDLGCSRGEALARVERERGALCKYVGFEVAQPMLDAARARFRDVPHVVIAEHDLRKGYPSFDGSWLSTYPTSVVLSVLCLQFVPIEHRQRIIRGVCTDLTHGGCFVLVEKVLGATVEVDDLLTGLYYDRKRANGYSDDDIARKRLALEGVLVPVTAKWNEDMLRSAGFSSVDCVWRWGPFAAWVALR